MGDSVRFERRRASNAPRFREISRSQAVVGPGNRSALSQAGASRLGKPEALRCIGRKPQSVSEFAAALTLAQHDRLLVRVHAPCTPQAVQGSTLARRENPPKGGFAGGRCELGVLDRQAGAVEGCEASAAVGVAAEVGVQLTARDPLIEDLRRFGERRTHGPSEFAAT